MSELLNAKEKWPIGALAKKDYRNMAIDELVQEFDLYLQVYDDIAAIEAYIEEQNQKLGQLEEEANGIRNRKPNYVYTTTFFGGIIMGIITWILASSFFAGLFMGIISAIAIWWVLSKIHMFLHGAQQAEEAEHFLQTSNPPILAEIDLSNDYINYLHNDLQLDSLLAGMVGPDNANPYCVNRLAELLKSSRADNLKEALNLYDEIKHREHMEEMANLSASEALKQTELLKDVEANSHAAANAAKANAAFSYATYRNTKKIAKRK